MISWKCDKCDSGHAGHEPNIVLKGYTGWSGGILLPESLQEKHFCKNECLEAWLIEDAQVQNIYNSKNKL